MFFQMLIFTWNTWVYIHVIVYGTYHFVMYVFSTSFYSTLGSGLFIIAARMSIAKQNRMGVQESDQNWMAEGSTFILLYMLMMMWRMDGTWNY